MKILQLFLLLGVLCFARDNPFAPVENIAKFTQLPKQDKHFKKADFSLPDSARVLKKVDVYYQNLDGSISRRVVQIDKKIDWHDEFMLTYKKDLQNQKKAKRTTLLTAEKTQQNQSENEIKSFKYKGFISFKVGKKRLEIFTKDRKIRDFMVDKPYKIVIDFKRDTNFLTKSFKVDMPPFVSIVLGNHDKYYRVAIELDGQYVYSLKKAKGDYIVTLK
ncbi:MAG: AMIN domain-containing protein [Sulfurospirillum sp.]